MNKHISPYSVSKEIPLSKIEIQDDFWSPILETNRSSAIFHQWKMLEKYKTINNFRIISGEKEGFREGFFYTDSDSHKWAEAAATILATTESSELKELTSEYFELLMNIQEEDGYINTFNQFHFPNMRWLNFLIEHEFYILGHLIEGLLAYYKSSNNEKYLDFGKKIADLLVKEFSEISPKETPGHPEIELALIKLYRITENRAYLELAEVFIEKRGRNTVFSLDMLKQFFSHNSRIKEVKEQKEKYFNDTSVTVTKSLEDLEKAIPVGSSLKRYFTTMIRNLQLSIRFYLSVLSGKYLQQHTPIRKMTTPVGHCVRWNYFATSAAMLYQEIGDISILESLENAWDRMVTKRMFVTGGLGSLALLEGFGRDYELNGRLAHNETCAAVSSIFWSWEMLQITGDAKYADLIELQLYNAALVGISLDGRSYFYRNPLETRRIFTRKKWYKTACCPSNISRTLAKLGHYIYTMNEKCLWVHQYISNKTEVSTSNESKLSFEIDSKLPWNGSVHIKLNSLNNNNTSLFLRIPSWCKNEIIIVNNEPETSQRISDNGTLTASSYSPFNSYYHKITGINNGEIDIKINLDSDVKIHKSHPKVRYNRNRIVLTKGPLVYCFEDIDNPDSNIPNARIDLSQPIIEEPSEIHQGMVILRAIDIEGNLLTAIPYYAWGNRDPSKIQVWIDY